MSNVKEHPRYNVISIRVSDQEKAALDEVMRRNSTTVSTFMREAIQLYTPHLKVTAGRG